MRVLIIGGTGLISTGIAKHLRQRGAQLTFLNRGLRSSDPSQITVDRNDFTAFEQAVGGRTFDVVMDMICFKPEQAESDVRAFAGRCGHFIFCSTVCAYGVKVPPGVLVDETISMAPISEYGRGKLACEQVFLKAHEQKKMPVTIIRPSNTYGPKHPLIDNIEPNPVAWDRIARGEPILCAGDGLGLWVSTHRDDCGKLFAHAAMNPKTFGESYNATRDVTLTWRDYLKTVASAIGKPAQVLFMPAKWIIVHDPKRFQLLDEITQFHGAYSSAKARRDVPEFKCEIDFATGAAAKISEIRNTPAWRRSQDDSVYESMVRKALSSGIEPVTL